MATKHNDCLCTVLTQGHAGTMIATVVVVALPEDVLQSCALHKHATPDSDVQDRDQHASSCRELRILPAPVWSPQGPATPTGSSCARGCLTPSPQTTSGRPGSLVYALTEGCHSAHCTCQISRARPPDISGCACAFKAQCFRVQSRHGVQCIIAWCRCYSVWGLGTVSRV